MWKTSCLACSLLLAGCAIPLDIRVTADCLWFSDQSFSDETKAWIRRDGDPPQHVKDDLNKVAKNNDKSKEFCGESNVPIQ